MTTTLYRQRRLNQRGDHPAGRGLGQLALVPARTQPLVGLDAEALAGLASLYGSSCVTPWADRGEPELTERAYELLELSEDFEVWVIHWPIEGRLQLHDHGGSSGALWVVAGSLEEGTASGPGTYERRRIEAGRGISFGPEHIHDVANTGTEVATSVHVYSPPMEKMTFFASNQSGLAPERTEYRADPAWAP
jgi:mannose-6-phosphate isomerase-like protein (cupin superfamily)